MPSPKPKDRLSWVNSPVLVEALQRYERGELARPLQLWLETLLEIEPTPARAFTPQRLLPHGDEELGPALPGTSAG